MDPCMKNIEIIKYSINFKTFQGIDIFTFHVRLNSKQFDYC